MPFISFPTQDQALIDSVNRAIAEKFASGKSRDFIAAFNADIERLMQCLENPPSKRHLYRTAYLLQEEYNATLAENKQKRAVSESDFDSVKYASRNLSALIQEYNQALRRYDMRVSKDELMQKITNRKDACWQQIKDISHGDENERQELDNLIKDWTYQAVFASFDTNDLLVMLDEMHNFEWYLQFIIRGLDKSNKVDDSTKKIFLDNMEFYDSLKGRLMSALSWRFRAADLKQDLYYDDAYWALWVSLRKWCKGSELVGIGFVSMPDVETRGLGPENFKLLTHVLVNSNCEFEQGILKNNFWLDNDALMIPIKAHGLQTVPKNLDAMIPDHLSWYPGQWIRRFFFKIQEEATFFLRWIKQILVSEPSSNILIVNESERQMKALNADLDNIQTLDALVSHSGFQLSLECHVLIQEEQNRADRFNLPWWLRMMTVIPYFYQSNEVFLNLYVNDLHKAEDAIQKEGKKSVEAILKLLERQLLQDIEKRVFLLPPDLFEKLRKFMNLYGSEEDKRRYENIVSPVHIFSEFNLRKPVDDHMSQYVINDDAVDAFLRYAEKYWDENDQRAAIAVMDIVRGVAYPKTTEENSELIKNLQYWMPPTSDSDALNDLLKMIAEKYVMPTGDKNNRNAYLFLEQYSQQSAKIWKNEKENEVKKKYEKIVRYFSSKNGKEEIIDDEYENSKLAEISSILRDIYEDESLKSKYHEPIMKAMKIYIEQNAYNGQSPNYLPLIYILCKKSSSMELFSSVLITRMRYLNAQSHIALLPQELNLMGVVGLDPLLRAKIESFLESEYQGENIKLLNWVGATNCEQLKSLYASKRFNQLIRTVNNQDFLNEESHFKEMSACLEFKEKVSVTLSINLTSFLSQQDSKELSHSNLPYLIETYGTQELKEQLRLIQIRDLFDAIDASLIEDYFRVFGEGSVSNMAVVLFKSEDTLKQLNDLVDQKVQQMLDESDWRGNWQSLCEILLDEKNDLRLHKAHLAWFKEYIFKTKSFKKDATEHREMHDLKQHAKNALCPSDQCSLEMFYGNQMDALIAFVFKKLDSFDLKTDSSVLNFISRYLQTPVLRAHAEWNHYDTKLDIFKKSKILCALIDEKRYSDASPILSELKNGLFSTTALSVQHQEADELTKYYTKALTDIEQFMFDHYCSLLFSVDILSTISLGLEMQFEETEDIKTFRAMLLNDRNLGEYEQRYKQLENPERVYVALNDFIGKMQPENLNHLQLTLDRAQEFSRFLPVESKQWIAGRLEFIARMFSFDEDFTAIITSFNRILFNDLSQDNDDINVLTNNVGYAAKLSSLIQLNLDKLIEKIAIRENLLEEPLLKVDHEYLKAFLKSHDNKNIRKLGEAVFKSFWAFLNLEATPALKSEADQWPLYSDLFNLLSELGGITKSEAESIYKTIDKAVEDAVRAIDHLTQQITIKPKDSVSVVHKRNTLSVLSQSVPDIEIERTKQWECSALKNVLLTRTFGDSKHIMKLEAALERLSLSKRRAMMLYDDPSLEQPLNFSFDVIELGAAGSLKQDNRSLRQLWAQYSQSKTLQHKDAVALYALRSVIPLYVKEVNSHLFDYFLQKFAHDKDDKPKGIKLLEKLESLKTDCLIDGLTTCEEIQGKYNVEYFKGVLAEVFGKHSIMHPTRPESRHANRLFSAFCISVKAEALAQSWVERLTEEDADHRAFVPNTISTELLAMAEASKSFISVSTSNFVNDLKDAIQVSDHYFVTWTEEAPQNRVKLRA